MNSDSREAEADAYAIADNKLGELATWDDAALPDILRQIRDADESALKVIGFSDAELHRLLPPDDPGADEDAPEPDLAQKRWQVELGQLWEVPSRSTPGRAHRVLCGDSTDSVAVDRLRGGDAWRMMVTDPPYGVEYDPTWRDGHGGFSDKKTVMRGKVENDDRVDWSTAWALWAPGVAYVWHASWFIGDVQRQLHAANIQTRALLIWRKQHFQLSRGDYHWQHEPCWYAVRKDARSGWAGDRTQSTIWDIANMNPAGKSQDEGDARTGHGTQKPVECMARPIRNHFEPGIIVADPFLGSGTTVVAAEREKRLCYGMELDPRYVAQILERLTKLGLEPRLA